jgi:hypothetical protein
MIKDIINIAAEAGFELVPLINGTALNAKLDEYVNTMKDGMFIMLPEAKEKRQRTYDHASIATIEIIATSHTPFTDDDVQDFNNVSDAVERLEDSIEEVVKALQESGMFEDVTRIRYRIYPYRYDSFQTVVSAMFDLTKSEMPC